MALKGQNYEFPLESVSQSGGEQLPETKNGTASRWAGGGRLLLRMTSCDKNGVAK